MNACRDLYPQLVVDLNKLKENLAAVHDRCHDSLVEVVGVAEGAGALEPVARAMAEGGTAYLGASRLDRIRALRRSGLQTPMMLLRTPMPGEVAQLVDLCEASLVSQAETLRLLNAEAERQGKTHRVVLMIDLGDLREGWWSAEKLVDAAVETEQQLRHLHLLGVGVNLSAYGAVKPDKRNMQGLVSLARDVEEAIGRPLEIVSGGASSSLGMVLNGTMPYRVNQLRLGRAILLGRTDFVDLDFLHHDVFTLRAQVVECREKPSHPVGQLAREGYVDRGIRRRALAAVGTGELGAGCLRPRMAGVEVLGVSDAYTVLDVQDAERTVRTGDVLAFDVDWAAAAGLSRAEGVTVVYRRDKE